MVRTNGVLIPENTSWLRDPAAQRVCAAVKNAGFDILFVGGCVRNALLGLPDSDVDMSTNAVPDQVTEIAQTNGLKAIPTGIDHGTVTVVSDGVPFEITTFRKDVKTDGRRAAVAFSQDIKDDALRRDFTMNALYATPQGVLIDPLGGLPDLQARRVRFIQDPNARIREDYLRILRFFRFSAWYAHPENGFDPEALAAIAGNLPGLQTLSGERVGQELTKLLAAPAPAPAMAVMRQIGVLHALLPGADDRFLAPLVHSEGALGVSPNWITRLATIGGDKPIDQLRLSKADAKTLTDISQAAYGEGVLNSVAYRKGLDVAVAALLIRSTFSETLPTSAELETLRTASTAKFPLSAKDLMPNFQGPALGERLRALEDRWIASEFTLSAEELLR